MTCPAAGSPFSTDVIVERDKAGNLVNIKTSRFRGMHTALNVDKDFIGALKAANNFTSTLNNRFKDMNIIPYSVFYIFFEQYSYILDVAFLSLGLALLAVFIVTLLTLGNITLSLIIVAIVSFIQVDLIGLMYLWGINVNALSVVNLVMAIGISVEFCVHIAHSFLLANGTRNERAHFALVNIGSAVFKGITLTKFIGVIVLGFANSQIFSSILL